MTAKVNLTDVEKNIFEAVDKNDVASLKTLLAKDQKVNIFDENCMTPLQHAAYKGNKEIVQILLDQGADVNVCQHEHGYTSLHFAGLSGNAEVCHLLLLAGSKIHTLNSVGRTAAQMAAFVGNHACVAKINNFIPKSEIDYYTVPQGLQKTAALPPFIAESFHKFVMQINIHPIRIALLLQRYNGLSDHLTDLKTVLEQMCTREMKRGAETNEVMAFKFHYFGYIVSDIIKCKERQNSMKKEETGEEKKSDFVELFARKLLKTGKDGGLDYMDSFLKECVREFPYRECTIFRQMVTSLASKDAPAALSVINAAINGQRGFVDNVTMCHTCGEEKPSKKCSKCKAVQYCDRECQRLHWFMHKKCCARLSQQDATTEKHAAPDASELSSQIKNLLVKN
ncbi:uncharacterized protein CBL_00737 [Carabus blaptoides fortunei]